MTVAIAVVASIVTALKFVGGPGNRVQSSAPSLWLLGAASLGLSSGFLLLYDRGLQHGLHPAVTLAGMLALESVAIALITFWSKRRGWGSRHVLGVATGAILSYGWFGITRMIAGSTALGVPTTTVDVVGQAVLLLGMLILIVMAERRLRRTEQPGHESAPAI